MRTLSRRQWFTKAGLIIPAAGLLRSTLAQTVLINSFRYAGGGGGGCGNTLQQTIEPGTDAFINNDDFDKFSTKFTASFTGVICRLDLRIKKLGAPGGTMKASIWSNSSNLPGTLIGNTSDSYNMTDAGTSFAYFSFTNVSASVTSGTVYFVVLEMTQQGDASNYLAWQYGSPSVGNNLALKDGGAAWNNFGFTSHQFETKIYQ